MNNQEEIWKDVPNWVGYYQISNFARVKSLERVIYDKYGTYHNVKERIMKISKCSNGYRFVTFCKNSKYKIKLLHRLLAESFISNPENKPCINHKNGIRIDNRIENIEWCTYSENNQHSIDYLGKQSPMKGKFGAKNVNSKPVSQYSLKGNFIKTFESCGDAQRKTGISRHNISGTCTGIVKNAGGYLWKYVNPK